MTDVQRNEILELLRNSGFTYCRYRPSDDGHFFLCSAGKKGKRYREFFLKEKNGRIGFWGSDYEIMRKWADSVIAPIFGIDGWTYGRRGGGRPKGEEAVWFNLVNNRMNGQEGTWFAQRQAVIDVAVKVYKTLMGHGIFAEEFNAENYAHVESKSADGINEIANQVVIGNVSQVSSEENNLDVTERNQPVRVKFKEQRKEGMSVAQAIRTETEVSSLMQQIIECGLKAKSTDSECHIVWKSQECTCLDDFHVPEPWNGEIANAELLFLSINPGYMANELYPRLGNKWWRDENGRWAVDRLNDFFINRFSSKNQYVRNDHGFSLRMEDGTYKVLRGHTFWGDIDRIATLILNRDVQIGRDYALTEIVHCKTKNQGGIRSRCYTKCMNLWLKKVLNVARKVERIIVVGGNPRTRICRFVEPKIDAPQRYKWYERSVLDGKELHWLFIDHPAAYQCRPVLRVEEMVKCNSI